MSLIRFYCSYSLLLFFLFLCSISAIPTQVNGDSTTKTMEDFSGYPIHEPSHSFSPTFLPSSLSVDAQTLQNQVLTLIVYHSSGILLPVLFISSSICLCCGLNLLLKWILFFRLMSYPLSLIHLLHQLLGFYTLRRMY